MQNNNALTNADVQYGCNGNLCCPRCGFADEGNLHHVAVTDYHRDKEDAPEGTITTIKGSKVVSQRGSMKDCPSSRRDGLTISFDCELCGDNLHLVIAQHKGSTEIGWIIAPATNLHADDDI